MPRPLRSALPRLRDHWLSLRDLALAAAPILLLAAALLALAWWALDPMPPARVVLASGPEQSAYDSFGARYAAELRRLGFDVILRRSEGSLDNLAQLRDPGSDIDVAFVRKGLEGGKEPLRSLGALFPEAVWIFVRPGPGRTAPRTLADLRGLRLNVGVVGSGVPRLMERLFQLYGLAPGELKLDHQADNLGIAAMFAGRLDAVAMVSAPESPLVQMLLITPGVSLMDLPHADAYSRRLPELEPVHLPRGIADLAGDVPPRRVDLVAAPTMLVTRADTHPALRQVLVQASAVIHAEPGWFQKRGEYPKLDASELPIDPEAARFHASGKPWLQRHLPFGMANFIDRMWVALLSLVAVLLPLSRIVPPLYELRVRRRVYRWYARLRDIENKLRTGSAERSAIVDELDGLDTTLGKLEVPLAYADELYALRAHVDTLRRRAESGGQAT